MNNNNRYRLYEDFDLSNVADPEDWTDTLSDTDDNAEIELCIEKAWTILKQYVKIQDYTPTPEYEGIGYCGPAKTIAARQGY